ncbi:hypothetical protein GCM10022232_03540 [Streptomyces plumbiresistens]|uniref:Uncharacterized protein n=1 Tax=Streptomyces plumbiresistens TaxID=511811 RepID=A0ABP7Q2Q6_9ACTN
MRVAHAVLGSAAGFVWLVLPGMTISTDVPVAISTDAPVAAAAPEDEETSGADLVLPLVVVGGVGALAGYAYLRRTRRARTRTTPGGTRTTPPAPPLTQLDGESRTLLAEADNWIRTSREELGFAEARSGPAAVAPFARAVRDAESELSAAFRIRRRYDAGVPPDEPSRRHALAGIVGRCQEVGRRLDEEAAAFDRLRALEGEIGEALTVAETRFRELTGRAATTGTTLADLAERYAPSATAPVTGYAEQAKDRLVFATTHLNRSRQAADSGEAEGAVRQLRAAEGAVAQAAAFVDGIDRLAAELSAAAAMVASTLTGAEAELSGVRGVLPTTGEWEQPADAGTGAMTGAVPDTGAGTGPGAVPDPGAGAGPDIGAGTRTGEGGTAEDARAGTGPDAGADAVPDIGAGTRTGEGGTAEDARAGTGPDAGADAVPDIGAGTRTGEGGTAEDARAGTGPDAGADAVPDTGAGTRTGEGGTAEDARAGTGPDAGADAVPDAGAGTTRGGAAEDAGRATRWARLPDAALLGVPVGELRSRVLHADTVLASVRQELTGGRPYDPLDVLRRIVRVLAPVATGRAGVLPAAARLAAGSATAVADTFVTTHRGAVGADARTLLAAARELLDAASLTDLVRAHTLARQARELAEQDVRVHGNPVAGAARHERGVAGAVLGGILLGEDADGGPAPSFGGPHTRAGRGLTSA